MWSSTRSDARRPRAGPWTTALVAAGLAFLAFLATAHGAATMPLATPDIVASPYHRMHFAGVDSRHRVYISGTFQSIGNVPVAYLARFIGNDVDASWRPVLERLRHESNATVLEDPRGRIVVALDGLLYRIDPEDGSRVENLGSCPFGIAALAIDPVRGDIYMACRPSGMLDAETAAHILRFLENGEKDPLFDVALEVLLRIPPGVRGIPTNVYAMAHDGGRYLYVAGILTVFAEGPPARQTSGLARIDTLSGAPDTSWMPLDHRSDATLAGRVVAIALAPPDWIYPVIGYKLRARFSLHGDGPIDPTWAPAGTVSTETVALDPARPRVYVSGVLYDARFFPFHEGPAAFSTNPGAALDLAWQPPAATATSMIFKDDILYLGHDTLPLFAGTPFTRRIVGALPAAAQPLVNSGIPRLSNVSTRAFVGSGDDVLITGFIVGGNAPKTVMVTAAGPSLAYAGIPKPLADPTLTLVRMSDRSLVAFNDDWGRAINAEGIRASGLAPADVLEPAIMATLEPGAYTVLVSGADGGSGEAVAAVYEMDLPQAPLESVATRGQLAWGEDAIIAGFVIQGAEPQTVVVSALGPSLARAGIERPLDDPKLTLVRASDGAVIAFNDNWVMDPEAAELAASGLAPADPHEAAVLLTLPPGAYTAIVQLARGDGGTGMVQVFAQ